LAALTEKKGERKRLCWIKKKKKTRGRAYLIKAKNVMRETLTTQPAAAKALGMVRAPVPTIRLNMYTRPTYKSQNKHVYSGFKVFKDHSSN